MRQGARRGDDHGGKGLLGKWRANFIRCRTVLTANDIEVSIRDGPRGKRPGPDGVPGEIYQRSASRLAEIFGECWGELLGDGRDVPQSGDQDMGAGPA